MAHHLLSGDWQAGLQEVFRVTNPMPARRLPIGAEVLPGDGVHFRVWAPRRRKVEVVLTHGGETLEAEMAAEKGGYFSVHLTQARAGMDYRYKLDSEGLFPDPASRFQPEGPHGPSRIVDPTAFSWTDGRWAGVRLPGQIIYEMHLGTFTREGTWAAAMKELPELAAVGITVLEVMPIADFPGTFGWGYDGVNLFAPTRLYGGPDDARRFVDAAHQLGLGVILDVVYNHVGPDGNYLKQYAEAYFTDRYKTDWGEAINFDGPDSGPVRDYFVANAAYWIDEFHFDGLRLDATQNVYDSSEDHFLAALARRTRAAASQRSILLVAENEPQDVRLVRPPEQNGYGLDALWNDDFHHTARLALTGRREAYYVDYLGSPQELVSALKWGYLYQGQYYTHHHKRRGTSSRGIPPSVFVTYVQNHDQIANSGRGQRIHELTSPGRLRALTALTLLGPGTPLLFQGQEFAASAPFLFFADHGPELAKLVRKGRAGFLAQFPSLAVPEMQTILADPADRATFERCKLDFAERQRHAPLYALHRDLLKLRRDDPVFRGQKERGVDGAVLAPRAFVLRYFGGDGDDRLLLVNLGRDLHLEVAPEPLLAPPEDQEWTLLWSSESPSYGTGGTAPVETEAGWFLPGESAVVLRPRERETSDDGCAG
jgi:maltooligosyltrehalose trehalohydrolase